RGVIRIGFLHRENEDSVVWELSERVSPRVLHAPARLDDARRQLDEYFGGSRTRFQLRTDRSLIHGFARAVLARTAQIPYGSYLTYGEVAAEAGSPRAHRAAGNALAHNPIPIVIPCHRVLRSGGAIGNYGGGPQDGVASHEGEQRAEDRHDVEQHGRAGAQRGPEEPQPPPQVGRGRAPRHRGLHALRRRRVSALPRRRQDLHPPRAEVREG